ncbi:TetR/AcrR family transcriptional regulator [Nocardia asteroides]|uniref:TetR/AcrR family transcriptional regulator n=1 Tax=Nocardia asteroides TaxID=1824 RepID=UPI001E518F86|nr:TetR/AcrR family transcriptional regulator [Nocardia asteroides]UGT60525.1 TetR/AcrR family transcriptional regulator [Nocardia asteroides]
MPRVSEEHLERRRQQIVDAAQRCFARRGFHQSSMQDVFAESGLSAGAVYRYFRSKDELVAALASNAGTDIRAVLIEAMRRDPLPTPAEVVGAVAAWMSENTGLEGRLRLAPQAWALALTDPEAAGYVRLAITGIRGMWREYAQRMMDEGWLPADTDLDAVAAVLFGLLPGFLLQFLIVGDLDPRTLERGVRALLPYGPA